MKNRIIINNLFAIVAISMGQKLKQLYDEVYAQDQSKTPEEVLAILEKLNLFCEDLDRQYSNSGPYLSILLGSAGDSASLYFRRYSEYLKELHRKGSSSKKTTQKKESPSPHKIHFALTRMHDQSKVSRQPMTKNRFIEAFSQDHPVDKHITEFRLFNKYQHATEGSVEFIKNDFMQHYDASKYASLDEFLLERSHALHMSPAKYKEDLIHGTQSKMEALVNMIEPGWSKEPPPVSDGGSANLKSS